MFGTHVLVEPHSGHDREAPSFWIRRYRLVPILEVHPGYRVETPERTLRILRALDRPLREHAEWRYCLHHRRRFVITATHDEWATLSKLAQC